MTGFDHPHSDDLIFKKLQVMLKASSLSEPLKKMLIDAIGKRPSVPNFQELKSHVDLGKLPPELVLLLLQSGLLKLATGVASKSPVAMGLGARDLALLMWACSQASIDSPAFQRFSSHTKQLWRRHRAVWRRPIDRAREQQARSGGPSLQIPKEAIFVASGIITGVGVSTVTAAPVAIAAGAIVGYKGSELIYENKEKIIDFLRGASSSFAQGSVERDDWEPVPGFLRAT